MPAAYVLIHLDMSVDFADSLRDIRAVDGVKRADLIVGPMTASPLWKRKIPIIS